MPIGFKFKMPNAKRHMLLTSCLLLCGAVFAAGCKGETAGAQGSAPVKYAEARRLMDTICRITVVAETKAEGKAAAGAAFDEILRLIKVFNDYDPESEISRLVALQNQPKRKSTFVSEDLSRCLEQARHVWKASEGAFDPTVGQLVDFWKSAALKDYLPTRDQAKSVTELVGMDKIHFSLMKAKTKEKVDGKERSSETERIGVFFTILGMRLDLGGIAKGYIVRQAALVLKKRGIKGAMVDAGGNIHCLGTRLDGKPWRIGVQDPREVEGAPRIVARISLENLAVSTSAHYYRFFEIGKKRFSHIIDPRTGWPVDKRVGSVTVVGPDAGLCDGYSTAIAVMGPADGIKMIEGMQGYECLVILQDEQGKLTQKRSSGFAAIELRL